ncbi:MAG: peptidylprolyl isomerase [Flavobacteriaceae bacterium]|nr:peptidylprolyl isomerase [Flavobacteriaceae bacterium]|tara:strand:- start:131 stop:856 length:726 start_codon:yes stop_codon:yes gene_type:complete
MLKTKLIILSLAVLVLFNHCSKTDKKNSKKAIINKTESNETKKDSLINFKVLKEKDEKILLLNDKNAIPFFFNYQKENLEDKVRISTRFGDIDIQLYKNTPYHRANFIFLTKKKYFNGSTFHRVVPGFVIQGGNSDRKETAEKRRKIGKYLLPPDTRKGYKHHRGVISMPSSEIENPHKLASPYEFFIVQQAPGAYHLDGGYTAFGRVIKGMEVVDRINQQKIDGREAPLTNIHIEVSIIE